jgi:glutathione synthase
MVDAMYPPQQTSDEIGHLVTVIKDWSIAHGLAVRPHPAIVSDEVDPHHILATTAPVTLFPSPFPRVCFDQALSIQEAYNELYASISQDEEFLKGIVEE